MVLIAHGPWTLCDSIVRRIDADSYVVSQRTTTSVDCRRAERLPDNCLADVGSNEKWDSGPESVTFLQQLVKQQNDETGNKQLNDDEEADSSPNLRRQTVHASHHVDDSLADRNHHAKHWQHNKK